MKTNNFLRLIDTITHINRTNFIKLIEHPRVMLSESRELMMARYDILEAIKLNNNLGFNTFVDVGGASGEYSYSFKKMFPNSALYSFEPVPEYHLLKRYWDISMRPIEVPLWNKNTILDFNVSCDPRTSSVFKDVAKENKINRVIKMKARRFDSFYIPIKRPALLKIDVEGAEKEVLEGFGSKLKEFDIVIIEFSMDKVRKPSIIMDIMEKNGFFKFVQKDLRFGYNQSNMFFIRD